MQQLLLPSKMICRYCLYNEREREMFYLTTHSTHFIYGYMASDIWLRTILIVRKETRCRHIGYSYRLTARVLLYAPSHRRDSTCHGLCYTSRGALAGTSLYNEGNIYTSFSISINAHNCLYLQSKEIFILCNQEHSVDWIQDLRVN